mmetsp:Transcript_55933/g.119122  ORF Transcript_55933/g.119122 Transcript_55933/m.119122 type:complete len:87 (-) Transcript_55933:2256-2516(-)
MPAEWVCPIGERAPLGSGDPSEPFRVFSANLAEAIPALPSMPLLDHFGVSGGEEVNPRTLFGSANLKTSSLRLRMWRMATSEKTGS